MISTTAQAVPPTQVSNLVFSLSFLILVGANYRQVLLLVLVDFTCNKIFYPVNFNPERVNQNKYLMVSTIMNRICNPQRASSQSVQLFSAKYCKENAHKAATSMKRSIVATFWLFWRESVIVHYFSPLLKNPKI